MIAPSTLNLPSHLHVYASAHLGLLATLGFIY